MGRSQNVFGSRNENGDVSISVSICRCRSDTVIPCYTHPGRKFDRSLTWSSSTSVKRLESVLCSRVCRSRFVTEEGSSGHGGAGEAGGTRDPTGTILRRRQSPTRPP